MSIIREVTIGECRLIQGDALAVLPTLGEVASVVTDPPYSSGGQFRGDRARPAEHGKYSGTAEVTKFTEFTGDSRDQRGYLAWCSVWMGMCRDICMDAGVMCVFTDWRQLPTTTDAVQGGGWIWRGLVPWVKTAYRPQSGRFAAQCEYVVWSSNGAMPVNWDAACLPGFFEARPPVASEREHLSQKPVDVIEGLVRIAPGGVILDPFMGSGTTGVACANRGQPFIGIEKSEEYFDIAVRRIEQAYADSALFTGAAK